MECSLLFPHTSQAVLFLTAEAPAGLCHPPAVGGREGAPQAGTSGFCATPRLGQPAGDFAEELSQEERMEETSTLTYKPVTKRQAR